MMNTSGGLGSVTAVTKPHLSWDCGEFRVNELAAQRFEAFERPLLTAPISREYPATSAARIAARRRVWLMFPHRRPIWGRSPKRALRSRGCTRSHMIPGRERAARAGGGGCNELYADYGRPGTNGGMPCIRGLRIPVATVVGMVADGMAETEILAAYPDLQREDFPEALRFAADAVRERELPLTVP